MTGIRIPVMVPWLGAEEQQAAAAAIASGWIAQGPRVAQFEQRFAERIGVEHAVAVSSCTTGLHLALHVAGVGPDDDVVVPSLSFIATANSVRYVGARPVFADVDPVTQNVTAETLEVACTDRTRAVIVVHQAGMPADLESIATWCASRGVALIEDAACAIGSTYRGAPIGASGNLAVFSFHPRKILTTGEGGMVVTSDEATAVRLRRLREHGMSVSAVERHTAVGVPPKESYLEVGFNYRMTDIQAAVGVVQLGRLDEVIARRRLLADRYAANLADLPGLRTPTDPPWGTTNHQSYCVKVGSHELREALMTHLHDRGISTRRGIMAAHLEPAYDPSGVSLPVTEELTATTLILPLYHSLTEAEIDEVSEEVRAKLAAAEEVVA
jgi:perosamine synthetase